MLPRYFNYDLFESYYSACIGSIAGVFCSSQVMGTSVHGAAIYGLKLGHGNNRVLVWSNMHGNETTTTRALLSFLKNKNLATLLDGLTLYIIPVLNPDGLNAWTRVNANKIDLNRDAQDLSQPESVILRNAFEDFKPHYCFNMHDQRSIYGNEKGDLPAQLSFLAPAADLERSFTPARLHAMNIINKVVDKVTPHVNGMIGRYSDAYNKHCVGDYFQTCGVPTVLFEAGHAGHDYYREHAASLIEIGFIEALKVVAGSAAINEKQIIETYNSVPPIAQNYVDILIKNVPYNRVQSDLAILYHETVIDGVLYFVPILVGINDALTKNAHRIIDCSTTKAFANDLTVDSNLVVSCLSLEVLSFH